MPFLLRLLNKDCTHALTKAQIAENIQSELKVTRIKSIKVVESLLELIKGSLASGDDVLISGFGKFRVLEKKDRRGRNPATGNGMMLPARRVVTFKCSGMLRGKINEGISRI